MKNVTAISALVIFVLFLGLLPAVGEAITYTITCSSVTKLQTYINTVPSNSTIVVKGTCNENVLIDETKINITINGGGTATIHGPLHASAANPTVWVKGRGIVIQGLTITGGYNGIQVGRGGTATIESNTIQLTKNHGIDLTTGGYAIILNNTIQDNPSNGIEVHDNASAHIGFVFYTDTVAQPNTIQNNGNCGIDIQRTSSASIVGNTIKNNTKDGINVQRDSHADIDDNLINGNGNNGIGVEYNSGVNLANTPNSHPMFNTANTTTVNNGKYGIYCTIGGYADGLLGTLNGVTAATDFINGCFNNL